jgi:hypothetical protein
MVLLRRTAHGHPVPLDQRIQCKGRTRLALAPRTMAALGEHRAVMQSVAQLPAAASTLKTLLLALRHDTFSFLAAATLHLTA